MAPFIKLGDKFESDLHCIRMLLSGFKLIPTVKMICDDKSAHIRNLLM